MQFIGIVGTQNQQLYMVLMKGDGRLFLRQGEFFVTNFVFLLE